MTKIIMTAIFVMGIIGFSSCSLTGSGTLITTNRPVASFTAIEFEFPGNMEIKYGATQSIDITIDDNIEPLLLTEVENGVLRIKSKPFSFIGANSMSLTITVPELKYVFNNGVGNITNHSYYPATSIAITNNGTGSMYLAVAADSITVYNNGTGTMGIAMNTALANTANNGTGEFKLAGSATTHYLYNNGTGNTQAFLLNTITNYVTNNGTGNMEVNVSGYLNAFINGTGNITYKGTPTLIIKQNGTGTISSAN